MRLAIALALIATPALAQDFPGSHPANIPGLEQPDDKKSNGKTPKPIDLDEKQAQADSLQQQANQAEANVAAAQLRERAALSELQAKLNTARMLQQQQQGR